MAITLHEYAHAITADWLGDPTPRLQKRITFNPMAHLDYYGLFFLLVAGFGWGKPVVFDPFNLKHPRRDAALISLAGPVTNFILVLFLATIIRLLPSFELIIYPFIRLNLILGLFNLIPIHPLDGFKIVGGIVSRQMANSWLKLERYGVIFLILLIIPLGKTSLLDLFLNPAVSVILSVLMP